MSEDAEFWDDEPVERYGGWAFIVITLIRVRHLCALLRDRRGAGGDDGDQGADWSNEGAIHFHREGL